MADTTTHEALRQCRDALHTAEAALADIGDADREPGDDVAWCEARAAEDLPMVRAALAAADAALSAVKPASLDVERMLAECVPGGSLCDPQVVADAIRSYFASSPDALSVTADLVAGPTDAELLETARSTIHVLRAECNRLRDDRDLEKKWRKDADDDRVKLGAELDKWEKTLSAVMPADYKDWHESDRSAWPELAASCIVNARRMFDADGRLIEALKRNTAIAKAAPDMLACLDDIAKAWGTLPFTSPGGLKQRIDAAIAKARGDDHE